MTSLAQLPPPLAARVPLATRKVSPAAGRLAAHPGVHRHAEH